MAEFVYLDETGSVGKGANKQSYLTLVAVVVDETQVQPLAERMRSIAFDALRWLPEDFEFHGNEIWNASGYWKNLAPAELLAAYEAVVALLEELQISIVHSSINKPGLHTKYSGTADGNAYLLALQFLLEKLDRWRTGQVLRVLIADEQKQQQVKAIKLVREMQSWGFSGIVPGRQLKSIIDSIHFVDSAHSPGVQFADMVAYLLHRRRIAPPSHPLAAAAQERMLELVTVRTPTWRESWP